MYRPVPIPSMPWGCADISAMCQHGNNGELHSFLLSLTCFCTQVPSAHVGMHYPPPLLICLRTCVAHPHATCPHAHLPAYPPAPLLARSLAHSLVHPPFLPILPPVLPLIHPFSHSFTHLTDGGATPSTGDGGMTPSRQHMVQHTTTWHDTQCRQHATWQHDGDRQQHAVA